MDGQKVIAVYVRKGVDDLERTLAFTPPPEWDSDKLLDLGFAIDGRDAVASVTPEAWWNEYDLSKRGLSVGIHRFDPDEHDAPHQSLQGALASVQRGLRDALRELGYRVQFK